MNHWIWLQDNSNNTGHQEQSSNSIIISILAQNSNMETDSRRQSFNVRQSGIDCACTFSGAYFYLTFSGVGHPKFLEFPSFNLNFKILLVIKEIQCRPKRLSPSYLLARRYVGLNRHCIKY